MPRRIRIPQGNANPTLDSNDPRKPKVVKKHSLKPNEAITVKNPRPRPPRVILVEPGETVMIVMAEGGPGESSSSPREK